MPTARRTRNRKPSALIVRMDRVSRALLSEAAQLRRISVSDYVRTVTLAQAQREVQSARDRIISLSVADQLALWQALNETPRLTKAQRQLGAIMRGEACA